MFIITVVYREEVLVVITMGRGAHLIPRCAIRLDCALRGAGKTNHVSLSYLVLAVHLQPPCTE